MDNLKPCPFCGSDAGEQDIIIVGRGLCKMVFCEKCHIDFKNPTSIEQWNTRPAEDALTAEVERLKSDLEGQNLVSKLAYADIRKLGDENDRLKKELEFQENLTRQQCFLIQEAYKENDKWKKMFYDLIDKQASVSTDPRVVIVGKDNNVLTNAPDTNVGTMESEVKNE